MTARTAGEAATPPVAGAAAGSGDGAPPRRPVRVGRRRVAVAVVSLAVLAVAVLGLLRATAPERTPSLSERVDRVAATLKCPTCGGLSLAESTSVLAQGARQVISQQLAEGRTPDQVRQYFVDRYGEQVLLSPDPGGPGLLAWLVPALALPGAGLLVWRWTRRRPRPDDGALTAGGDDDARAALAAFRAGTLEPDPSPAGDALHAALLAREAAEQDEPDGGEVVRRADARLGAAYRRYAARPAVANPAASPARPARTVPRRVVLIGSAVLVVGAAGVGVGASLHGRAPGEGVTGAAAAASPSTAGSGSGARAAALPSPPPGWTGGMPTTYQQWVDFGRAYDRAQQFSRAVAAYDMALRLQPGADDVTLLRASALLRSGDAAGALPDLQRLEGTYPDNAEVLLVLGLAQNRTGSPQAPATLRRFLQLAPDSPAAPGVRHLLGDR